MVLVVIVSGRVRGEVIASVEALEVVVVSVGVLAGVVSGEVLGGLVSGGILGGVVCG